jgi:hypothetical protein
MGEGPDDVAVAQDSRSDRALLDPLDWDKAMVAGLAQDQGVFVRPLARRLVDRVTGEASTVVLPCGSTRESRCPTCARKAGFCGCTSARRAGTASTSCPRSTSSPATTSSAMSSTPTPTPTTRMTMRMTVTGRVGWCARPVAGLMPRICRCAR